MSGPNHNQADQAVNLGRDVTKEQAERVLRESLERYARTGFLSPPIYVRGEVSS